MINATSRVWIIPLDGYNVRLSLNGSIFSKSPWSNNIQWAAWNRRIVLSLVWGRWGWRGTLDGKSWRLARREWHVASRHLALPPRARVYYTYDTLRTKSEPINIYCEHYAKLIEDDFMHHTLTNDVSVLI